MVTAASCQLLCFLLLAAALSSVAAQVSGNYRTHLAADGYLWAGPDANTSCRGSNIQSLAGLLRRDPRIKAVLSDVHKDIEGATRAASSSNDGLSILHSFMMMQPSPFETASLMALLEVVTNILFAAGVPFCLAGGSLVGAFRHYGRVPWDDDVTLF
ncbi:unnamed protein product, partial [Polarella glacialis]